MTTAEQPLVDTRDMIVVHTALLREFRLAPAAVRRTGTGDERQAEVVTDHLRFVCDLLHHHHEGEDELLWPKLQQRTPPEVLETIAVAESQHEGLDAALQRVDRLLGSWAGSPDAVRREELAEALEELYRLLSEHLDFEERALLPIAAGVLSEQEWKALGEAAMAALPKPALPLVFGMFAYEGDPAVLRDMLKEAPALPRMLLPVIAPRIYARRSRKVHGTATP